MFPKGTLSAISALVIKAQNQSSWQAICKNLHSRRFPFPSKAFLIRLLQLFILFSLLLFIAVLSHLL